jgi:hypothetical protein
VDTSLQSRHSKGQTLAAPAMAPVAAGGGGAEATQTLPAPTRLPGFAADLPGRHGPRRLTKGDDR